MTRLALSSAASALLRTLVLRAGVPCDRILLTEWRSTDWQSLTFVGERHQIGLRICGPDAVQACEQLANGLSDAEFALPGQIVGDITIIGKPESSSDGSLTLSIEALTIAE